MTAVQTCSPDRDAAPANGLRLATAFRKPAPPRRGAERAVRVCFMIDTLYTGGTEGQLVALIRHLDRTRVRPSLCVLRGASAFSHALEADGCPVLHLGAGSLCRPSTLARARRLAQFLRRERTDVLQVYFAESTYLGALVARLAGVRFVVRTRNNLGYWLTPWHRRLGRLYNRLADATIANCEACRQAVIRDEAASPESVVVLENGVDLERFAAIPPLKERPGPIRVGVVANLRPVKGVDLFLRAAAAVVAAGQDATFAVAGDGPERAALERLAAEVGLGDRLRLPGVVEDVPGFLAGLDVAVLCSRSEGMSNALLEYMAAGRAIVATRVGAADQILRAGATGLLVPPAETDIAAALRRVVGDAALRVQLGHAARRRAEMHYSRAAMVRRFEDFYRALVFGSPPPGAQLF